MCFALAFGRCPSRSSPRSGAPSLRSAHSDVFSRSRHHPGSPSSRSSGVLHRCVGSGLIAEMDPRLAPVARLRRSLRLSGPFDACRCTLTRSFVRPCGLTPTGWVCLPQLFSFRASASPVSCWIVHGHPTFRGFSPPTAGDSRKLRVNEAALEFRSPSTRVDASYQSSMPFPALRRRGSEDFSLLADACSDDSVVHAIEGSLLSWLFPPFEDDLPASPVALLPGLLSWAFIIDARLPSPCGSGQAHTDVRSSECQRSGSTGTLARTLLRGVHASATRPPKRAWADRKSTRLNSSH